MRKKYKITGFARFLIFLILFAPLAYIGASYYNNEDGIANIKNVLGIEKSSEQSIHEKEAKIKELEQKISVLNSEIDHLKSNPK